MADEKESEGIVELISMDKDCLKMEGQKYWFIFTTDEVRKQVKAINKSDHVKIKTKWNVGRKRTEIIHIEEIGGVGHGK